MIILIDATNKDQYPELVESMFRLRKRVFIDQMKWNIPHQDGLEIDQFDDEDTIYFVATVDGKNCIGTWRGYPTTKPYMVETVFPQFFGDHEIVKNKHAYEFSRSAVDWEAVGMDGRKVRLVHIEIFCATVEWCIMHNVFEAVSFTDPRMTRRTSYLYGAPKWAGEVMDCGDGGMAQCMIYQPSFGQLSKFRNELNIASPVIAQYSSASGEFAKVG